MKLSLITLGIAGMLTFAHACTTPSIHNPETGGKTPKKTPQELAKLHKAYFAMGCFWCVEGVFESIKGVEEVVSGYEGGTTDNPTYEEVGGGRTSHAEAVEIYYDSSVVDFPTLLKVYFAAGDPTQVNGQGPDHGSQYRSIIFYQNIKEKMLAEDMIADLTAKKKYQRPISVEVKAHDRFWKAEEYHQDYIPQHPENPYVQHESIPRMQRAQAQLGDLVKPEKRR
jgi:peptide-methionine (S)-S-oxide reductase